jgi:hypothetical protein
MKPYGFFNYRKYSFRKNKMVQDALIVLLPPLLLLIGLLIALFVAHHPQ